MIKPQADPVLLIYFAKGTKGLTSKLGLGDFGTPIPIYLSEKLTGLYVDTERRRLSIATESIVAVKTDKKTKKKTYGKLEIQQKGETQAVDISLIGRIDSMGLNLLLPMLQTIYDEVIAVENYRIAYFHKNILIFNARLAGLDVNQSRENDLVSVDISLEVSPLQEKEDADPIEVAANPAQNVSI